MDPPFFVSKITETPYAFPQQQSYTAFNSEKGHRTMIEIDGNIFDEIGKADAICITTNCTFRKDNKRIVCGKGIAGEAAKIWPEFESLLGSLSLANGKANLFLPRLVLVDNNTNIMSLPTKYHWRDKSDLSLIKSSVIHISVLAIQLNWQRVCIPRPGCDNGGLNWESQVKPAIGMFLDQERFVVYSKPKFAI